MTCDDQFLTAPHWQRIGVRHHHGICLPLSCLITEKSSGIGEYLDLIPLIRWLASTGFDLIQLLPINDTGFDASPYMALSANALHPIYLSLSSLPNAEKVPGFLDALKSLHALNHTPSVLYRTVLVGKLRALRLYLDHRLSEIEQDPDFLAFLEEHRSWLTPYSIFRTLQHVHHGKAWWEWEVSALPKRSTFHTDAALAREILRWRAIQYLCFSQFKQVRAAATSSGVLLNGDVPILINKDSADVWWHPELFSLKKDVGAPPDMYNPEGQHWGFPVFRWSAHRKNKFAWWKQRLHVQEGLYDLYRLDHLVGFFRIYAIPPGKSAKYGSFIPKNPEVWKRLGEEILTMMIHSTQMLPLAEDLGNVPDLVRESMHTLGVPGLKVMRWERRWKTDQSFIPPSLYSPESVTTLSTHDSSTIRGWWEQESEQSQKMAYDFNLVWRPKLSHALLLDLFKLSHSSGSLFHINLFNEYLSIFKELSWGDPEKERINRPGTISPSNWVYRTKLPLEKIMEHTHLHSTLKALIC